jgi:hypothetical protein
MPLRLRGEKRFRTFLDLLPFKPGDFRVST